MDDVETDSTVACIKSVAILPPAPVWQRQEIFNQNMVKETFGPVSEQSLAKPGTVATAVILANIGGATVHADPCCGWPSNDH